MKRDDYDDDDGLFCCVDREMKKFFLIIQRSKTFQFTAAATQRGAGRQSSSREREILNPFYLVFLFLFFMRVS